MRCSGAVLWIAFLLNLSPAWPQSSGDAGLPALVQTIAVPGVKGGFNHMSVDAGRQRLFAAASTNMTLEIIDLKNGKPWKTLAGDKPAAARYAPEFDQLYVTRGQSLVIYSGESYEVIATIPLESNLDELQYDAQHGRLYVGCMSADKTGIAVISIPDGKLIGKIALPDKPQGIAVDEKHGRVFANMPDLRQVAVMDGQHLSLVAQWQLGPGLANMPLAIDDAHERLLVGTRHPAQLQVLDAETGKSIAAVDSSADADDMFYDAARRRIYISCGEGNLVVIGQSGANDYKLLGHVPTIAAARTSAFSSHLGRLYIAVPAREDQPAEILVFATGKVK